MRKPDTLREYQIEIDKLETKLFFYDTSVRSVFKRGRPSNVEVKKRRAREKKKKGMENLLKVLRAECQLFYGECCLWPEGESPSFAAYYEGTYWFDDDFDAWKKSEYNKIEDLESIYVRWVQYPLDNIYKYGYDKAVEMQNAEDERAHKKMIKMGYMCDSFI